MSNVTFVCDEAASLGANMTCLEDAIDKGRAYGIRLVVVYQSPGQLAVCFPKDGGRTLMSNVTQVYFAINDPQTAEDVSKRVGDHTVIAESGGRGSGTSWQKGMHPHSGGSSNANANWNQVGRRLLKPEELMCLDERIAITLAQGVRPIMTRLERYYEKGQAGPPRFQGIKTVLGTLLMLSLGTIWAIFATAYARRFTR